MGNKVNAQKWTGLRPKGQKGAATFWASAQRGTYRRGMRP